MAPQSSLYISVCVCSGWLAGWGSTDSLSNTLDAVRRNVPASELSPAQELPPLTQSRIQRWERARTTGEVVPDPFKALADQPYSIYD